VGLWDGLIGAGLSVIEGDWVIRKADVEYAIRKVRASRGDRYRPDNNGNRGNRGNRRGGGGRGGGRRRRGN
jgi:hypothetical protein